MASVTNTKYDRWIQLSDSVHAIDPLYYSLTGEVPAHPVQVLYGKAITDRVYLRHWRAWQVLEAKDLSLGRSAHKVCNAMAYIEYLKHEALYEASELAYITQIRISLKSPKDVPWNLLSNRRDPVTLIMYDVWTVPKEKGLR